MGRTGLSMSIAWPALACAALEACWPLAGLAMGRTRQGLGWRWPSHGWTALAMGWLGHGMGYSWAGNGSGGPWAVLAMG